MSAPFPYLLIPKQDRLAVYAIHPSILSYLAGCASFPRPFPPNPRLSLRIGNLYPRTPARFSSRGSVERAHMTYNRLVSTVIVSAPYSRKILPQTQPRIYGKRSKTYSAGDCSLTAASACISPPARRGCCSEAGCSSAADSSSARQ